MAEASAATVDPVPASGGDTGGAWAPPTFYPGGQSTPKLFDHRTEQSTRQSTKIALLLARNLHCKKRTSGAVGIWQSLLRLSLVYTRWLTGRETFTKTREPLVSASWCVVYSRVVMAHVITCRQVW